MQPADNNPTTDNGEFDELIVEWYERRDSGEAIEPAAFIAAHPEFKEQLEQYFADVEAIELMAGPPASEADQPDVEGTFITNDTHEMAQVETIVTDENGRSPGQPESDSAESTLTEFGRYRIVKELGRGAMGAVYLAHDGQLDREVALKIPQFGGEITEAMLERFYREARAAAALRHPGICPVHDVGEIDGQHYITMAYIQGRPLRDFTKSSKRQEAKQVARVIRKIALAMAEAHQHDVIHRDLKPANVMIDQRNEPVVMDFGLARRSVEGEERLTHTGTILGTPAYMSPEQVDGDNENVGAAADIYSLGIIFYEMLAGQLPFRGSLMSILKQIGSNDPQPPSELHENVDRSLEEICLKMLAKEASDRPTSMMEVAESLSAWLQGRRSGVEESGLLETSRVPGQAGKQLTGQEATNPATVPGRARVESESESFPAFADSSQMAATTNRASGDQPPGKRKLLLAGGLGSVVLLLAGLTFFFRLGKYDVQVTLDDPSITLSVDDGALIVSGTDSDTIRLTDGPHKLKAEIGDLTAKLDEFTVKKDGKNAVHVAIREGRPVFNPADKVPAPDSLSTSTPAPNIVKADAGTPPPTSHAEPAIPELAQGLLFEDKDSLVKLPNLPIDYVKPFAVEMWCKLAPEPVDRHRLLFKSGDFHLRISPPKYTDTSVWTAMVDSPSLFKWGRRSECNSFDDSLPTHILYQWTGDSIQYWINGVRLDGSIIPSGDLPDPGTAAFLDLLTSRKHSIFAIGNDIDGHHSFQGSIWSTKFYQGIVVDQDEFDVHNPPATNATIIASYDFDEGTGDVLHDSSGNDHHGKIIGAKWVGLGAQSPSEGQAVAARQIELLTSPAYEWTRPVNLGPEINSKEKENHPTVSGDGLVLIFESGRDSNSMRLFESRRSSTDEPWALARPIDELNQVKATDPHLSRDGLSLLFAGPHEGKQKLWLTRRSTRDAVWQEPVDPGPEVNSGGMLWGGELSPDGLTLYFKRRAENARNFALWRTHRSTVAAPWKKATRLESPVNSNSFLDGVQLLADGKSLLIARSDGTNFLARRNAAGKLESQGVKTNFHFINFTLTDSGSLIFTWSRTDMGFGDRDLWMSRRVRKTDAPAPPSATGRK